LRWLNISGNPCASSPDAIAKLKSAMPYLEVVHEDTSPSSPTTNSSRGDIEDSKSDDDMNSSSLDPMAAAVLSSEQILREVVDRKCRLQSYSQFNIESAIEVGCKLVCESYGM
jgi:hypothetical protein